MAMTELFRRKAPGIMAILMRDFSLTVEDAAAILGNLGHESGGFRLMQEVHPLVAGSKGGYGWAQWTGERRRLFEAWCTERRLDPASDEANMGFLERELRTSHLGAVGAVRRAPLGEGSDALRRKVVAFELSFERAAEQYKHYDSRVRWANIALAAYRQAHRESAVAPDNAPDEAERRPTLAAGDLTAAEITTAQDALHKLKFYEVGASDGLIGSRTIAAVAAFRHERGVPGPALLDRAVIAELERAETEDWTRPIAAERVEGMPDGSRIVASTERQAAVTTTTGGTLAAGGILAWLAQKFEQVQVMLDPLTPYLKPAMHLVLEYWWAFLGAGLAYLLIENAQVRRARIADHREGRTT